MLFRFFLRLDKNCYAGNCLDICPSGAVSWGEQGLNVAADRCTQCLRCMAACPTAALQSPELSLLEALSDLAAHPEPVLGCQLKSAAEAHASISCLGCLANPELMLLLALVFGEGLQVNLTGCRDCPKGDIREGIQAAQVRLAEIRPEHKIGLVIEKKNLNYSPPAFSRRELFGLLRNRSKRTALVMVERLQGEISVQSYGSKQVPPIRSLLLKAMKPLPETEQRNISDQLFGRVSFTSSCTGCGGCTGVCPTGALDTSDESRRPPDFDRKRCVGCGSCSAFCLKQGVESSSR